MKFAKTMVVFSTIVGIFMPVWTILHSFTILVTITPAATLSSTPTLTRTATPSRTPSATPTFVPTQTPFVVTVIHTKIVTELAPTLTPGITATNTVNPTAGGNEKETGNQSPLSIAIIGMLATFIGGLVVGILWSSWRKC